MLCPSGHQTSYQNKAYIQIPKKIITSLLVYNKTNKKKNNDKKIMNIFQSYVKNCATVQKSKKYEMQRASFLKMDPRISIAI